MSMKHMYQQAMNHPEVIEKMMEDFDIVMDIIKVEHPERYRDIKTNLYILVNGYHFDEDTLNDIYEDMVNDDGSRVPKWSVEETNSVARSNGISFRDFNEYDWNYAMNMIYSDYCEVLGDNVTSYVRMAHKFLNDKDAPDGKALRYAMCMKKKTTNKCSLFAYSQPKCFNGEVRGDGCDLSHILF